MINIHERMGRGPEVIKPEYSLKLKIKCNDWLLADMSASSQSLCFILSLRMNLSFITLGPGWDQTHDPGSAMGLAADCAMGPGT